jgi:hypothetical protein
LASAALRPARVAPRSSGEGVRTDPFLERLHGVWLGTVAKLAAAGQPLGRNACRLVQRRVGERSQQENLSAWDEG